MPLGMCTWYAFSSGLSRDLAPATAREHSEIVRPHAIWDARRVRARFAGGTSTTSTLSQDLSGISRLPKHKGKASTGPTAPESFRFSAP